jgi:hypothetical protein
MKLIYSLLFLLLFPWFQSGDFKVLDAEMQAFDSGRKESGSGINYRIQIVLNKKPSLIQFKGIWLNGRMYEPIIQGVSEEFSKGDTLLLTFTVWTSGSEHQMNETEKEASFHELPVEFKGKNVIEWKKRKKIHYKELPEFRKLPTRVNR